VEPDNFTPRAPKQIPQRHGIPGLFGHRSQQLTTGRRHGFDVIGASATHEDDDDNNTRTCPAARRCHQKPDHREDIVTRRRRRRSISTFQPIVVVLKE